MAHFFFSNEKYIDLMQRLGKESKAVHEALLQRLGVNAARENVVTILVIAKNEFMGYEAMFTLTEECERVYKRKINILLTRIVVLKDLSSASNSPHLERARFILIPDENLLTVDAYPELEKILPFEN